MNLSQHEHPEQSTAIAVLYFDRIDKRWKREIYPNHDEAHARYVVLNRAAFASNIRIERRS